MLLIIGKNKNKIYVSKKRSKFGDAKYEVKINKFVIGYFATRTRAVKFAKKWAKMWDWF